MGTADIQAAINSIPEKKEDLRKAFEELESHSSFFTSFTLQWKDIDDHFSSLEKSIDKRFQELKASSVSAANVNVDHDKPAIEPRPELKSLCVKMDARGLKSYIIGHWKDIVAIRRELGPALLCSPDLVALVLDASEGFVRSSEMTERDNKANMKAYLTILECFLGLKFEVKTSDKERARRVAKECDVLITNGKKGNVVVVMVFLHLIAAFGLLEFFAIDDVMDLIVTMANKRNIVDICRSSALEVKIPDLISKLNKKGRQLEAIKFVLAFNLQGLFPPASLFKAYIKESNKGLQKVAMKGNNSAQLKHGAISKQIAAIRAVMKAVEEYNLESQYSLVSLQNRLERLEKQRLEIRRGSSAFPQDHKEHEKQQHRPLNKRPRHPILR